MRTPDRTPGARLIDISPVVSPDTPVWPGDRPFEIDWTMRITDGCSCNVAAISMSAHTGAHTDAPYHFVEDGPAMSEVELDRYIGPVRVVDLSGAAAVTAAHLDGIDLDDEQRLLFRTRDDGPPTDFSAGFAHIAEDAARSIADAGLRLVGLDTPSVDPFASKTLTTHKILLSAGVAILEGVDLRRVTPGRYELIALPLRLAGLDGSPVRAVLRRIES